MKHWFIMDSLKCTCSGDLAYVVWSENWICEVPVVGHTKLILLWKVQEHNLNSWPNSKPPLAEICAAEVLIERTICFFQTRALIFCPKSYARWQVRDDFSQKNYSDQVSPVEQPFCESISHGLENTIKSQLSMLMGDRRAQWIEISWKIFISQLSQWCRLAQLSNLFKIWTFSSHWVCPPASRKGR